MPIESYANVYDEVASQYEEGFSKRLEITEAKTGALLQYLPVEGRVLNIGCAVGGETYFLSKKCFVTALDISPEMVKYARRRNEGNPRVQIVLGNFLEMHFANEFDGIYANAFIHLFPEHDVVLAKMRTALRKGGVALISTTPSECTREEIARKEDYQSTQKRYRKHWTQHDLQLALEAAGFTIVRFFETTDPFGKRMMDFIVQK